jgi:hypothetical protein
MTTRNGKIARLPRFVRDELNERLERSEESPQLLAWLNELPEVKEVVQDDFAGIPISKQNLSEWRQGGFEEWLARRELWEHAHNTMDFAEDLAGEGEHVLADDVATVLAARYAALLAKWDGEVDEKFEAKTRAINRLCRSVVQLQRSMHRAAKDNEDYIRRLDADDEEAKEKQKQKLMEKIMWGVQEPRLAKIIGGGTAGAELAKLISQIQTDQWEKPEDEEKPVKPATRKKTKTRKSAKPLQENEMDDEKEEESGPEQSGSVKLSQTDVAATGERKNDP